MKKFLWIFATIIVIIMSIIYGYFTFKHKSDIIISNNIEYERYLNQEVYGGDLATIINKIVDNNTKYNIEKDNKGKYIEDDENSIKLDIKILDNETMYDAETIYYGKIENFVKFYNTVQFKCTDIKYHPKTGKVRYLYFEQISY